MKNLIVFDVDVVLIHYRLEEIEGRQYDFRIGNYYTYVRPFATDIFTELSSDYDLHNFRVKQKIYAFRETLEPGESVRWK